MPSPDLLSQSLASTEFLALDTETNGLARERCELTEVGAVLVGGGELHDRWESLVGVSEPLGRGIQRFTGITQAMVASAPPPEAVLPELERLLRGRVLVAHNAQFDMRVLRQAFARAALTWPDPPVLCTVALARRFAPLQRRRGLAALADALGVEVAAVHRALPDAETCARILCALLPRLAAVAGTVGEALAALKPVRAGARRRVPGAKRARDQRPDLSRLPKDPGVYIFRDADGRPLYVGKSVCLRVRARSHFTTPVAWTGQAEHVDYQPTESELGALVLENRLIKRLLPPGNVNLKRSADGYVYLRCRLDIPFPILEVAREPAPGRAVCVGPVRGRAAAAELVEQLNSLFGLRHCGRGLPTRSWPSAYGQMGRCLSPCLGDLDPNLYRERLDAALRLFVTERDGGGALLAHVDAQIRAAAAERAYERAAWLQRRRARLDSLIRRLGGALRAAHAGTRLVLAPHPSDPARADAFWIAGGRVVDWGPAPGDARELGTRTTAALRDSPPPGLGGWLPAAELDEARIVGAWLAGHEEARTLELDPAPSEARLARFAAAVLRPPAGMTGAAPLDPTGAAPRPRGRGGVASAA